MSASSLLSAIASQFDADPNRNTYLSLAALQVNADWFVGKYDYAVALLAAHMMTVNGNSALSTTGGQIASMKEGDLAVSYSAQSGGSPGGGDDLQRTGYGKQFLNLREQCNVGIGVTGGNDSLDNSVVID